MLHHKTTKIALVDDHKLFRKGMAELLNGLDNYDVVWEAENGKEHIQKICSNTLPDIVVMDIKMPYMDCFETALWMKQHYPEVRILILTMFDDDETIRKMFQSGVNDYMLKSAAPEEFIVALETLVKKECFYNTKMLFGPNASPREPETKKVQLTEREINFLKLVCTELPYKSFAPILKLNFRAIKNYKDKLCKKLEVESRVGLVIYAIKHNIYKID